MPGASIYTAEHRAKIAGALRARAAAPRDRAAAHRAATAELFAILHPDADADVGIAELDRCVIRSRAWSSSPSASLAS